MDTRDTLPEYERACDFYWRFMNIIDRRCEDNKLARSGLISFLKNKEISDLVVCPTSKQFSKKTLKRFFCQHILQLSERPEIPIKEYDEYFTLGSSYRKNRIEIETLLKISNESLNMQELRKANSARDEDMGSLEGWTPFILLKKLRLLSYEKGLDYFNQTTVDDEAKKKKYIEFISAFVLYQIFWEESCEAGMSYYCENIPSSIMDTVMNFAEAPAMARAMKTTLLMPGIKKHFAPSLLAIWSVVVCSEFLSLRLVSRDNRISKGFSEKRLETLLEDETFEKLFQCVESLEKNNMKRYYDFDRKTECLDVSRMLYAEWNELEEIREDFRAYFEWIKEICENKTDYPYGQVMQEMKMCFYILPDGIDRYRGITN